MSERFWNVQYVWNIIWRLYAFTYVDPSSVLSVFVSQWIRRDLWLKNSKECLTFLRGDATIR